MHKLPYLCTVYADNCGSMKHVVDTCVSMGLNFQPLPPKDQSLNLAEKAIHIIFYAACCHLLESKRDPKYFPQAVDFACYSHLRTATTPSRGFITPYEAIKDAAPDVSHMRSFGVICYPVIDKGERASNKGTAQLKQPATKGIFLCYQNVWNNVYTVVIDETKGTVMSSRHVVFNLESADYSPLMPDSTHNNDHLIDLLGMPVNMPPVVPVEAEEANVENISSPSTPSALDIDTVPFSPHSASNLPEQQSQNDVGSPVSSFHFPPNVPNAGLQQDIAHQSDAPIAPVSPSSENISMSHNDSNATR